MTAPTNVHPFPVAQAWRDGTPILELDPRARAIRYLRDLLLDGRAGLDPEDPAILVADAENTADAFKTARALERCGLEIETGKFQQGIRFRYVLEADVRDELDLDQPGAPVKEGGRS